MLGILLKPQHRIVALFLVLVLVLAGLGLGLSNGAFEHNDRAALAAGRTSPQHGPDAADK